MHAPAWDELDELCLPDARFSYDVGGPEPLELQGAAMLGAHGSVLLESFAFYRYVPQVIAVTVDAPDVGRGRVNVLEVTASADTSEWQEIYGRYDDEYRRTEAGWCFARRAYRLQAQRTKDGSAVVADGGGGTAR